MALNKREQSLLWLVLILAVAFGNWFLVAPLAQSWNQIQGQIASQRNQLARVRSIVEQDAPRWRQEYDQIQTRLGERANVFSSTSDVLKKVDDLSTECGLTVPVKRTLPVIERDVYRELPVQCTLEGTLEGMVKFLHTLQTASGLVTVDQIQIYPPRPQDPSQLKCDLVVIALASKSAKSKS